MPKAIKLSISLPEHIVKAVTARNTGNLSATYAAQLDRYLALLEPAWESIEFVFAHTEIVFLRALCKGVAPLSVRDVSLFAHVVAGAAKLGATYGVDVRALAGKIEALTPLQVTALVDHVERP